MPVNGRKVNDNGPGTMRKLSQHPDIAWPPAFGDSYAAGQRLMAGLEGTLLRVEPILTVRPEPLQIRLVALFDGRELVGVLECRKPRLLAELRVKLSGRVGRPLISLGDIELPVNPIWHITVEGFAPGEWPGPDATFGLRSESRIFVQRTEENKDWVSATADIDGTSASTAAQWVYWKLREAGLISDQSGGLVNVSATDEQGRLAPVAIDAVVQKPESGP